MRAEPDRGQGSVELIGLLPLLVVVGLGIVQLLAAGVVHGLAGNAAENAAIALGDGEDPRDAAREALPGWAKDDVRVTVRGRRVSVRLVPATIFPGAGEALATVAHADAGPEAGEDPPARSTRTTSPARHLGAPAEPTLDDPRPVPAPRRTGGTR